MKLLTLCAGLLCASSTLAAVASVDLANYQLVGTYALPSVSFGQTVGNIGLEGVSYNPVTNTYFGVKEKQPQRIYQATIDWSVPSISLAADPFTPALNVADLSDIQVLASVPSLIGTPDEFNMLIYSQESRMLLEVSYTGAIHSSFNFLNIAPNAEGVTIGPDETIYVVGENPELYVLKPIPEPASMALLAAAIGNSSRISSPQSPIL